MSHRAEEKAAGRNATEAQIGQVPGPVARSPGALGGTLDAAHRARTVLGRLQAYEDVPEARAVLADHGHLLLA
ncbi:hypothetical protein [Streptomyces sp. WELS2]|uniref:hypothetical protein n=1 Tax=Streptomyces sp. WELS2 TaxID=2749435 RepID=UPI0015F0E054|nr:hypothetical protein [Streptomyces sp. WELS2]